MSFASRLPCLLALVFVAPGRAQQTQHPDAAPDPDGQLLLDLGNDERCVEAVRTLTHRGAAGVATLVAAIKDPQFHADERRLAIAIYALGKLGDVAAPAAPLLLEEAKESRGDVLRNVLWALGEIGPKAEAAGHHVLERLRAMQKPPRLQGWDYMEWAFAYRRTELGVDPSPSEVATLLQGEDSSELVAAAGFLCRAHPLASWPREDLLAAWTRTESFWRRGNTGYKRAMLELARAVVRQAPDAPEATSALAVLIYHFDVDVRLQAAMQMGQTPGSDPATSVAALQLALTDGSVHVRREAVTALGMIGPAAVDALPALQTLATDPDVQIRGRAAAAVHAIDRKGKSL